MLELTGTDVALSLIGFGTAFLAIVLYLKELGRRPEAKYKKLWTEAESRLAQERERFDCIENENKILDVQIAQLREEIEDLRNNPKHVIYTAGGHPVARVLGMLPDPAKGESIYINLQAHRSWEYTSKYAKCSLHVHGVRNGTDFTFQVRDLESIEECCARALEQMEGLPSNSHVSWDT